MRDPLFEAHMATMPHPDPSDLTSPSAAPGGASVEPLSYDPELVLRLAEVIAEMKLALNKRDADVAFWQSEFQRVKEQRGKLLAEVGQLSSRIEQPSACPAPFTGEEREHLLNTAAAWQRQLNETQQKLDLLVKNRSEAYAKLDLRLAQLATAVGDPNYLDWAYLIRQVALKFGTITEGSSSV